MTIHFLPIPDRKQAAAEVVRDLQEYRIAKELARSPDKVTRHMKAANDYKLRGQD